MSSKPFKDNGVYVGRTSRAQEEPLPPEPNWLKKICCDMSRSRSGYTISKLYKTLMPQERKASCEAWGPGGGQRPRRPVIRDRQRPSCSPARRL